MTNYEKHLQQSAILMRILGWLLALGLLALLFVYPPGFLWGAHPEGFPFIGTGSSPVALPGPASVPLHAGSDVCRIWHPVDPGRQGSPAQCCPVRLRHSVQRVARRGDVVPGFLLPQRTRPYVGRRSHALRVGYPAVDLAPES